MNVEAYVIKAFNDAGNLLQVPSYAEIPAKRPAQFITIERVGGRIFQHQTHAMVTVQCWAESRLQAAELADRVETLIWRMRGFPEVATAVVDSVYNFPDSESNQARYQLTVRFVLHL